MPWDGHIPEDYVPVANASTSLDPPRLSRRVSRDLLQLVDEGLITLEQARNMMPEEEAVVDDAMAPCVALNAFRDTLFLTLWSVLFLSLVWRDATALYLVKDTALSLKDASVYLITLMLTVAVPLLQWAFACVRFVVLRPLVMCMFGLGGVGYFLKKHLSRTPKKKQS